jgi:hypothetical protein
MDDDLGILDESVDVEPSIGSRPRVGVAIGAIVLLGVIAAVVGALVISAVVTVWPYLRAIYFP